MRRFCLAMAVSLACSGCATIFEGGTQPVTIKSVPEAATISVTNRAGEKIHTGITPATITLKRGAGYFKSESYQVDVSKPGYQSRTLTVSGGVNGWYVANLLFGGLIGLLIVDPITGAMYDLSPDTVEATLQSAGIDSSKVDGSLTILLAEDVPLELWQHARRINQ